MDLRNTVMGVGAATAVGAVGAVSLLTDGGPTNPAEEGREILREMPRALPPMEVALAAVPDPAAVRAKEIVFCLPQFVESDDGCLTKEALLRMDDQPIDRETADGVPRSRKVLMAHPTDYALPEREVLTCTDFGDLHSKGWGGITNADMVDESYFVRYCGLRSIAVLAEEPRTSKFNPDGLTEREISLIPPSDWPAMSEEDRPTDPPVISQAENNPRTWIADTPTLMMRVHDVALADFDGDGEGERLLFLAGRARGGTAGFGSYAILEREGEETIRIRNIKLK